jgi:hypothetical protein
MTPNIVCWRYDPMVKDMIPQCGNEGFKSSSLQPIYMQRLVLKCYLG